MAKLTPQERIAKRRAEDAAKRQRELLGSGIGGTIKKPKAVVTAQPITTPQTAVPTEQVSQPLGDQSPQPARILTAEEKVAQQTQQSFGETPLTSEQRKQELLSQQASKKDLLDAQIAQQRLASERSLREARITQEGNVAALQSQFISAPGGLVASTGEPLVAGISAVQAERIDTFTKQVQLQRTQADSLKKQLEIAQREKRFEFAADLQKQIAQAEALQAQAEEGAATAKAEATAETLALQKSEQAANIKAIEVIGDIPASALINMTPETIEAIANSVGGTISPMLASGYISQVR